jgi:hypothetical protein
MVAASRQEERDHDERSEHGHRLSPSRPWYIRVGRTELLRERTPSPSLALAAAARERMGGSNEESDVLLVLRATRLNGLDGCHPENGDENSEQFEDSHGRKDTAWRHS